MNKTWQLKLIVFSIFIIGLGLYFVWPKGMATKQVAGAQTQEDPNHPIEVYFSEPQVMTLREALSDLKVEVWPEDVIKAVPPTEMGVGSRIAISRAMPLEVTDAKVTRTFRTWQKTVGEFLKEKNIELIGKDSVEPPLETELRANAKIKITRVAEVEVTIKESIDYKTSKTEDIDMEKGQSKVTQKGVKGEKEVKYLVKRVDGVEVSRKVLEANILKEPIIEKVIIGIGPKYVRSGPHQDLLNAAAKKTLVNATALQCLMLRESGGSADAGYPDAYYKGLFQYEEGYWAAASARAGFEGASIYDAKAQIFTTANELARGQGRRWPPYRHCADK